MNKDEFPIAMLVVGIGVLLLLVVFSFVLFTAVHVGSVHSGGCTNIPLVNGQPAYRCNALTP